MTLPQPAVALTDVCAVMFNNTLYTYSSDAFQSLAFAKGADWKQLAPGESVTGGVCLGTTPADAAQAGFYVIGGTSSASNYTGLQKFTYATGKWEVITPQSLVTQDRLYHSAVYINDTDTILMYAGSQDGDTGKSTQTFTIGASSPYSVLAYQSIAPPTKYPILLQWSSSEAVLVGGSSTNTQIMLFSPTTGGWKDSGATLASALAKDISSMQAALITGDDNSKNLYTLDMSVSPNKVSRVVLMDGAGQPVTNSVPVKRALPGDSWNGMRARTDSNSLTLSDWPAYNSSLAPTVTRTGFSIAEGSDGTIVAAGGGGSDLLCVFNGRENTWRNATEIFATTKKSTIEVSSSSSASASASSTATTLVIASSPTSSEASAATSSAAATSAAAAATSSGTSAGTIVGAVLGSVAGLGIIFLVAFLLILRRRKQKNQKEAAHNRQLSEGGSSEKDAYDVINGSSMPRPIGGGVAGKAVFRGNHQAQESQGSFSSVAILMGRVNQPRPVITIQGNDSRDAKRSSDSSVFKAFKSTISKPIPQAMAEQSMAAAAIPQQAQFERADTTPYGASVAPPRPPNDQTLQPDSTRRSSGWNRYWSGGSALNIIGFGNGNGNGAGNGGSNGNMQNVSSNRTTVLSDTSSRYSMGDHNRMTQDTAMVAPLALPVMPDAKPRFQRVNSGSPTVANFHSYLSDGMEGKIERSISQSSSRSGLSSGIPASVQDTWDPTGYNEKPWGTDRAPPSAYSTPLAPGPVAGTKKSYVPTGMSQQPQLASANTSSDMSWLNLGDVSRV